MNLLPLFLIVATLFVTAFVVYLIGALVASDGSRSHRRQPPRSHHTDQFDPRSRLA